MGTKTLVEIIQHEDGSLEVIKDDDMDDFEVAELLEECAGYIRAMEEE